MISQGRMLELLADRALWGLDDLESAELARLRRRLGVGDDDGCDHVAAVLALAVPVEEELPASLRREIRAGAERAFAPPALRPPVSGG